MSNHKEIKEELKKWILIVFYFHCDLLEIYF